MPQSTDEGHSSKLRRGVRCLPFVRFPEALFSGRPWRPGLPIELHNNPPLLDMFAFARNTITLGRSASRVAPNVRRCAPKLRRSTAIYPRGISSVHRPRFLSNPTCRLTHTTLASDMNRPASRPSSRRRTSTPSSSSGTGSRRGTSRTSSLAGTTAPSPPRGRRRSSRPGSRSRRPASSPAWRSPACRSGPSRRCRGASSRPI